MARRSWRWLGIYRHRGIDGRRNMKRRPAAKALSGESAKSRSATQAALDAGVYEGMAASMCERRGSSGGTGALA